MNKKHKKTVVRENNFEREVGDLFSEERNFRNN